MSDNVKPYGETELNKKQQVALMFDKIAHKYDFLNHFLSLGIDILWRKKAISLLKKAQPKQILDVATGTGDLAIEALKLNPEKVTGIDVSAGMLELGKEKIKAQQLDSKIELLQGDSENLPFTHNSFDAITVAFGVRNFENLKKGITEMNRVLKPGGQVVVLEFSTPERFPFKQLYHFYFRTILPLIGKLISKDPRAYSYLPESVKAFPNKKDFAGILQECGFHEVKFLPLTFGIATIHTGYKK